MSKNPDATAVRRVFDAYRISIPDDELTELAAACLAIRRAAERVLAAEPIAPDIAVTFDPAAS
jgi:hypothetical protein